MPYDQETLAKARRLIFQANQDAATDEARARIDEITLHTDGMVYPDTDFPEGGIVALGDWNSIYAEVAGGNVEVVDDTVSDLNNELSAIGVVLGWCDEYAACDCCNRLISIQPDSYGWLPTEAAIPEVGDHVCQECVVNDHLEAYLESRENNDRKSVTLQGVNPEDHGYVAILECEKGVHGGQLDDPENIGPAIRKQGITRYLFKVDSKGQWDVAFTVYVHQDEADTFDEVKYRKDYVVPRDPRDVQREYLQNAPLVQPSGSGTAVTTQDPNDPTKAVVRVVSALDFINGKAFDGDASRN